MKVDKESKNYLRELFVSWSPHGNSASAHVPKCPGDGAIWLIPVSAPLGNLGSISMTTQGRLIIGVSKSFRPRPRTFLSFSVRQIGRWSKCGACVHDPAGDADNLSILKASFAPHEQLAPLHSAKFKGWLCELSGGAARSRDVHF